MNNGKENVANITASIKEIVIQFLPKEVIDINTYDNYQEYYNLGSIDVIQIILEIEKKFEIQFPEEYLNIDNIRSIDALASTVEKILKVIK